MEYEDGAAIRYGNAAGFGGDAFDGIDCRGAN